ncbi:MAG TPA: hypothetical protein VK013_10860 [Myxococcaceae bacterium]|nr:hypothetical protein [Myxococcaceae bacterium]
MQDSPPQPPVPTTPAKPPLSVRLKGLIDAYGPVAITLYLAIFAINIAAAAIAIRYFGWQPESAAGTGGLLFVAWASAKALQPLRILLTLTLTPLVARLVGRGPRDVSNDEGPQPPEGSGI